MCLKTHYIKTRKTKMSEELLMLNGGIQTVMPTTAIATPQIVYLDFDGAETSYYNRDLNITIDNVTVYDSQFGDDDISAIVTSLNEHFDDVVFTSSMPAEGEFSTIYIGVTSAFDEYGDFLGLAETIDSGNQIHDDNAFVLLDSSASAELVVSVIAHETEHIVHGMEHGGNNLEQYAAIIRVSNGVTSSGLVISGGSLFISSGGTANDTTMISGGTMHISSFGTANNTTLNGFNYSYCVLIVHSDGTANSTTVNANAYVSVFNGGTANSTTMNAGWMTVYSGGTAMDIIENGGNVNVMDGATVTFVPNVIQGESFTSKSLTVHSGTTANNTIVNHDASMRVYSGGVANNTSVNRYGHLTVFSGGTANGTIVKGGSTSEVNSIYSSGYLTVSSGGTANATILNSGGYLYVSSGGTANATIVNNGGYLYVSIGGTANSTIVNQYGHLTVSSSGKANETIVNNGGYLYVFSGGTASILYSPWNRGTIGSEDGACITYLDRDVAIYYGNYSAGVISYANSMNSVEVTSGNSLLIYDGGIVSDVTVNSRGYLYLSSGGLLCGNIIISSGGIVNAISGGIIDFTVAEQTAASSPLINSYANISGATNATYTLTISASQATNLYTLAGYANSFNATVSVNLLEDNTSRDIGTISVGGKLFDNRKFYRLLLDSDNTLKLDIRSCTINPVAGASGSFDEAVTEDAPILLDSTNPIYNYTDGLNATLPLEVIGTSADTTTLAGGNLYLGGNNASFCDLTLNGQFFGGVSRSSGGTFIGDVDITLSNVVITNGKRIYGGAEASSSAVVVMGGINLDMENVNGGNARIFGAGKVADKAILVTGDIDITVSCAEDGSFSNLFAGADVVTGFTGTIVCGDVNTTINSGTFTYCGNGSQLRGGGSIQNDSTLTINGGTFNHFVYAGAFSAGGTATVDGNSTLVINAGTFTTHVFGGCGTPGTDEGVQFSAKTLVSGNANVRVNATSNTIEFKANIYAGSMGHGNIGGGTSMTFTGHGSNLLFATNSYITGNSQKYRGSVQYVGGDQTLEFNGFTGDFGANINNGFSRLTLSNSSVSFTGETQVVLNSIAKWEMEVCSADAELTLGKGKNSFKGDTLNLTIADGVTPDDDGWDVIAGTADTLTGWNMFSSVTLDGETATYANGEWSSDNYRLFKEGNTLKLATIVA